MQARSFGMVVSVVLIAMAGCTATGQQAPLEGIGHTGANTAKRGTPEFCRYYAGQAFTEKYRQTASTEEPDTTSARSSGDDAYRRRLAGRTN
ncbi:hypothetical protein [Aureimonas leprariae]|uniref:Lipoprotein n=1 Tax=Plantimonas leprariae TaxID=2615207 RepID=A0A7V7PMM9_9HYPH|nr:hypothetical protein [Aureimonas leprariae]KAB0678498.1 hypothetical protein F6X38_15840 [Aureimonas leprariae]